MHKDDKYYLRILQENGGYDDETRWIEYAKSRNFQRVESKKIYKCPSCGSEEVVTFAQYIYFSNIIRIKSCICGLYFSDTLLAPETIAQYFEKKYKDESYFCQKRKYIFEYLSELTDIYTPQGGVVLDIGGGKGHLLNIIKERRPDAKVTLNDLSQNSCAYSKKIFGINSICCSLSELKHVKEKFNTILLIDVIYYEPELNSMFENINNLLKDRGALIIRIPNKLSIIKISQSLFQYFGSRDEKYFQSKVKYYNPEHIYIFSKTYIKQKLENIGFNNVKFIPSPLLCSNRDEINIAIKAFFKLSRLINKISVGRIVLTPSMIIVASR